MGEPGICGVADWGEQPYARACAWQKELVALRKAGELPDLLILCAHPHVITLGRNARRENLRLSEAMLAARGVEVHPTDRGGDVTYHGPGQLVGYPILDLSEHRKDVVWYVRALEEVLIRAAAEFIEHVLLVRRTSGLATKVAVLANRVRDITCIADTLDDFLRGIDLPFVATLRDSQHYIVAAERGLGLFELAPAAMTPDIEQWEPLMKWLQSKRSIPKAA